MSEPVYNQDVKVEWNGKEEFKGTITYPESVVSSQIDAMPHQCSVSITRGSSNPELTTTIDYAAFAMSNPRGCTDGIVHADDYGYATGAVGNTDCNVQAINRVARFNENVSSTPAVLVVDHNHDLVSSAIANGDIDCTFAIPAESSLHAIANGDEYPTISGVSATIGYVEFPPVWKGSEISNEDISKMSDCDTDTGFVIDVATEQERGITIEGAVSNQEINIVTPDAWNEHVANYENKKEDKILSKREMALAFMMQKDGIKIDIKKELNIALKKYPQRVEFIQNLFNTKVAFKQYKHVNFATKRIVLNNLLRGKLLIHSADTNEAVNDILVLLENDSNHSTYLHNLRIALSEIVSKGIRLV